MPTPRTEARTPWLLGAVAADHSQLTLQVSPSVKENFLIQGDALPRGSPHPVIG